MFVVFGSGFGLYGYLPALVEGCSQSIALPIRYKSRFSERSELIGFSGAVQWYNEESEILKRADGVVLALPPIIQNEKLSQFIPSPNLRYLFLEKPLAYNPEAAFSVLENLYRSGKSFRIGYLFRYTGWGNKLIEHLGTKKNCTSISISWQFLAHHFQHDLKNWKRYESSGGGIVRFYGIHLIALLAEIGYNEVLSSQTFGISDDEVEKWSAILSGKDLPECTLWVDSKSSLRQFHVEGCIDSEGERNHVLFSDISDPFASEGFYSQNGKQDSRVPILIKHCRSLWDVGDDHVFPWYESTISLWRLIERKTVFQHL